MNAVDPDKTEQRAGELLEAKSEILRLRAQLRRTEEERDILKTAIVALPRPFVQKHPAAYIDRAGPWPSAFWRLRPRQKTWPLGIMRTQLWCRFVRPRLVK